MAKTPTKPKSTRKTPKTIRTKKAGANRARATKTPAKRVQPARPKATKANRVTAPAKARLETKQAVLIERLRRKEGATIAELMQVTCWQAHSVRGAISGTLKKKLGLDVTSETVEGRGRVYRIA